MKNIVIFASGNGSNAQRIADYFSGSQDVKICKIYTNKSDAYVIKRAEKMGIAHFIFNRDDFYKSNIIIQELENDKPDLIVLAGFLWLIPESVLNAYGGKIINIHPALLPAYGGKGMYGSKVHEAVIANGEKESGISIHYVNSKYDEGELIFQAKCTITPNDTADSLASKIHELEYAHFPVVIDQLLT